MEILTLFVTRIKSITLYYKIISLRCSGLNFLDYCVRSLDFLKNSNHSIFQVITNILRSNCTNRDFWKKNETLRLIAVDNRVVRISLNSKNISLIKEISEIVRVECPKAKILPYR